MTVFLIIIIIILVGVISTQYISARKRTNSLKYMYNKLNSIIENETSEKLLTFTSDREIIAFLNSINNLLEHNQKMLAEYTKSEISMRKMLSNISHDLKTPLTVILGYIETMRLDNNMANEERDSMLLKVQNKANELIELINKFFDLTKLESGDKDIPLTRININEVCRKNILAFYDILTCKSIEVIVDIPEANIYVLANEEALDRIINNLISNAIKYGSSGNIIGLSLKGDNEFACVSIWDKGKGINEINKDNVFERMYTLEDSRNKQYQGSGLGLTITKRLVEKLGGTISLYSKPYEKTIFSFKLKRITY